MMKNNCGVKAKVERKETFRVTLENLIIDEFERKIPAILA